MDYTYFNWVLELALTIYLALLIVFSVFALPMMYWHFKATKSPFPWITVTIRLLTYPAWIFFSLCSPPAYLDSVGKFYSDKTKGK